MPTINSFTQSPSATQIVAYLAVFFGIIIFYTCITPNFSPLIPNIILSILYGLSTLLLIIFASLSSYIDPSDPIIAQYKENLRNNRPFSSKNYYHCGLCQSYCDQSSKHCKNCKRCVVGFDHHCIWINNCIGTRNYRWFFLMISMVIVKLGLFLVAAIWISIENRWREFLAQMVVVWVYCLVAFVLMFLDFNLLVFHLYLNAKGISTYQFIMIQKEEEKEKKREEIIRAHKKNQIKPEVSYNVLKVHKQQISPEKSNEKQKSQNVTNDKKDSSKQSSKFQGQYQSGDGLNDKINVLQRIQQDHSEGDISIAQNPNQHQQRQQSQANQQRLKLSKWMTSNKSMQLIIHASRTDVAEPFRLKTTNSEIN